MSPRFLHVLRGRRGQALLEVAIISPVLLALFMLMLTALLGLGGIFLLEDRMDEALVCLSYRPFRVCEAELQRFISASGLQHLEARTDFFRGSSSWTGRFELKMPGGQKWRMERSIRLPLRNNRS